MLDAVIVASEFMVFTLFERCSYSLWNISYEPGNMGCDENIKEI